MVFAQNDYDDGEELFQNILDNIDQYSKVDFPKVELAFSKWASKFIKELMEVEPRWVPTIEMCCTNVKTALRNDYLTNPTYQVQRDSYPTRFELIEKHFKYVLELASQIIGENDFTPKFGKDVFIVHGRDHELRDTVKSYIEKLGYNAVILSQQPNHGFSIFDKIEYYSKNIGFAIILLTGDDVGHLKGEENKIKPRARQNVILEWGYFRAILGPKRLAIINDGVEIPNDMVGFGYYTLNDWKEQLAKDINYAFSSN